MKTLTTSRRLHTHNTYLTHCSTQILNLSPIKPYFTFSQIFPRSHKIKHLLSQCTKLQALIPISSTQNTYQTDFHLVLSIFINGLYK